MSDLPFQDFLQDCPEEPETLWFPGRLSDTEARSRISEVLTAWGSDMYERSDDAVAKMAATARVGTLRPDDNPPVDFEPGTCFVACGEDHPEASSWTEVSLIWKDHTP